MNREIHIQYSKTLKLTNALLFSLSKEEDFEQFENVQTFIDQMGLLICQRGAHPIGPLIQKTSIDDGNGEPKMNISFIRQADKFIHHVDPPYTMESIIKVSDCLYTRFIGEEKDMQFAYSKLNLTGYEEEIELTGESYTVFVDNDEDGAITADIFMPKKQA